MGGVKKATGVSLIKYTCILEVNSEELSVIMSNLLFLRKYLLYNYGVSSIYPLLSYCNY